MPTGWVFEDVQDIAKIIGKALHDAGCEPVNWVRTFDDSMMQVPNVQDGDVVSVDSMLPESSVDDRPHSSAGEQLCRVIRDREIACLLLWHSSNELASQLRRQLGLFWTGEAGGPDSIAICTRVMSTQYIKDYEPVPPPLKLECRVSGEGRVQHRLDNADAADELTMLRLRIAAYVIEASRIVESLKEGHALQVLVGEYDGCDPTSIATRAVSLEMRGPFFEFARLFGGFNDLAELFEALHAKGDEGLPEEVRLQTVRVFREHGPVGPISEQLLTMIQHVYDQHSTSGKSRFAEISRKCAGISHDILIHGFAKHYGTTQYDHYDNAALDELLNAFQASTQTAILNADRLRRNYDAGLAPIETIDHVFNYVHRTIDDTHDEMIPSRTLRRHALESVSSPSGELLCDICDMLFAAGSSVAKVLQDARSHLFAMAEALKEIETALENESFTTVPTAADDAWPVHRVQRSIRGCIVAFRQLEQDELKCLRLCRESL